VLKALKVILIVWAATGILMGLAFLFIPEQLGAMQGYEQGPAYIPYFLAMLGIGMIVPSIFIIVAMTRDLLKNILWVQMAITWAILLVAVDVYSALIGFVSFNQVMMPVIVDGVFFVLLMVFYPWGRTEEY
jgi:hypothetical protein